MRVSAKLSVLMVLLMGLIMPAVKAQDKAEIANALSATPKDPVAVIVIPSLEGLSKKFDKWIDAFAEAGIQVPPDAKGEMLDEFKQKGADKYVDLNAPVIFAQMGAYEDDNWETEEDESSKNMLVILKVKDADLLAKELGLEGQGVMKVKSTTKLEDGTEIPDEDAPGYILLSNGYALMSDNEALLKAYKAGNNAGGIYNALGKLNQSMLFESDVVLYTDMQRVKELSKEDFAAALKEFETEVLADVPVEFGDLGKTIVDVTKTLVNDFVNDAKASVVAFKIDDSGVRMSTGIQFSNGTYSKLFASSPASNALNRLPAVPYFMASSGSVDPKPYVDLAMPIIDKLIGSTEEKEIVLPVLNMYKKSIAAADTVSSQQYLWVAPEQADMTCLTQILAVQATTDPAGIVKLQKENLDIMKKVGEKMAAEQDQQAPEVVYEENVMQMEGRQIDKYKSAFPQEAMDMMGPAAAIFGSGVEMYISPGKDNVVYGMTKDTGLLKKALTASGGEGKLYQDAGIKAVQPLLRGDRSLELYINLGQIYKSANDFSNALQGAPLPLALDAAMPPLTITGSQKDGGAVIDIILTKKTIIEMAKAAEAGQAMGAPLPF